MLRREREREEVGEGIPTGGVWSVPGRGILQVRGFKNNGGISSGQPFAPGREQRCHSRESKE